MGDKKRGKSSKEIGKTIERKIDRWRYEKKMERDIVKDRWKEKRKRGRQREMKRRGETRKIFTWLQMKGRKE